MISIRRCPLSIATDKHFKMIIDLQHGRARVAAALSYHRMKQSKQPLVSQSREAYAEIDDEMVRNEWMHSNSL
jgi:hypothetical protein